jgi:prepilin-type N-terminal cleavage/methylation domain-containing protein
MVKINRGERGFSLIEMMTAITLLSVLSLAVFNPKFPAPTNITP